MNTPIAAQRAINNQNASPVRGKVVEFNRAVSFVDVVLTILILIGFPVVFMAFSYNKPFMIGCFIGLAVAYVIKVLMLGCVYCLIDIAHNTRTVAEKEDF